MNRFIQVIHKICNIGLKDHYDVFEKTNSILINQIQLMINAYLALFLIKDSMIASQDFLLTFSIFCVMVGFFFIRDRISYNAAVYFQLSACLIAIAIEQFTHANLLRVETLYLTTFLLSNILISSVRIRLFYGVFIFAVYIGIQGYITKFNLSAINDVSDLDNLMIVLFAFYMVMIVTYRYFSLIKELISRQMKLLESLQQKNGELERFAYVTSHDLKQPLRNISSFSGLLKRFINDPKKAEKNLEYLHQIETSSKRMSTLVEQILGFSKVDKAQCEKEIVDFNFLVEEFKNSHAVLLKNKKVTIDSAELPRVYGNKLNLSLLVQNLIENGIKYNQSQLPYIKIEAHTEGDKHQLTFSDNGIGIPEESHDTIFKPFERLHTQQNYEGTGLGLSICKKIVDDQMGEISVTTDKEIGGSKFIISLPRLEDVLGSGKNQH